MLFTLLTVAALAAASPIRPDKGKGKDVFTPPPGLEPTYTSPYNSSLPRVAILATGGTIAGKGAGATSSGSYSAGAIGVEALIEAVPDLIDRANIVGFQVANVGSPSINSTIQLQIAHAANELLCSKDSVTDGIVVTHGTDTLEETAFFRESGAIV